MCGTTVVQSVLQKRGHAAVIRHVCEVMLDGAILEVPGRIMTEGPDV